ncbi:MAG: hypothetical protein H6658_01955 [Ardenticatenaceae bacterium]|nr:hypothetical protein [Ardenticatenaceae bacterium]
MRYKTVGLKFGMTQNLGDYTNTRPEVELVAELSDDDDVHQALGELSGLATTTVHNLVDDELEFAGREVKYSTEQLYQVRYSKLRRCVVIFPAGLDLPVERTWKEADSWNSAGHSWPSRMRLATAEKAANQCREESYVLVFFPHAKNVDSNQLPALPDPGPEPVWYTKGLADLFGRLQIRDKDVWEELALLPHVTADYLQALYNADAERRNSTQGLIAIIRDNKPWPPVRELAEPEDDEDDDEDWDDDDF